MKKLRSTYVHRGDAIRRRKRLRSLFAFVGITGAALLVIANRSPAPATAEAAAVSGGSSGFSLSLISENRRLRQELSNSLGDASLLRAQYDRASRILEYSNRYDISAKLATVIFDVAIAERVDPELAFRLVNLESGFNPRAVSRVGAIGLAQLMPSTAIQFERSATRDQLYDPHTNLRIGFRYLRRLIGQYGGDVRLALLAYNLGEDAVDRARRSGKNPLDGYNRILIKAYQGSGITN